MPREGQSCFQNGGPIAGRNHDFLRFGCAMVGEAVHLGVVLALQDLDLFLPLIYTLPTWIGRLKRSSAASASCRASSAPWPSSYTADPSRFSFSCSLPSAGLKVRDGFVHFKLALNRCCPCVSVFFPREVEYLCLGRISALLQASPDSLRDRGCELLRRTSTCLTRMILVTELLRRTCCTFGESVDRRQEAGCLA